MESPLYIAVEGPIGVGKTTLVERLAERLQAQIVLESFEDNPFLPRFYEDRDRFAFQTQLFFLMSRFRQQQELMQPDLFRPNILADYHLLKDRIFAELTLADQELALYERVYRSLATQILKPDVVIYLTAPLSTLLARIARRGREIERNMDPEYLRSLSRAYQHFFSHYDDTPLLRVDNDRLDYATRRPEATAIIDEIVARLRALATSGRPVREDFRYSLKEASVS
jgi:deoxyadenosine/deoxycytidine kinase